MVKVFCLLEAPHVKPDLAEFVAEVAAGLGDSRRIHRATQYVEALLQESSEQKNFAQLARLAASDDEEPYLMEQAFQHLVNGSSWEPDVLLHPAIEKIAGEIDLRAMMLLAVVFPRLGEHLPQYAQRNKHQIASVLQVVGTDRRGEPVILPIKWRLSLENEERWFNWKLRERADVDYPIGVHISVLGAEQVATVVDWDVTSDIPLVAGPSYERLRAKWLQTERWPPYVVEVPPATAWVTQAELETLLGTRPDAPSLERLDVDTIAARDIADGTWSLYSLSGELGEERVIVCEPPDAGDRIVKKAWCTNLRIASSEEFLNVARLTQLRARCRGFWDEMRYATLGAAGYRGLSVKGWERHCALVTVAQAYRIHASEVEKAVPKIPEGRREAEPNWRSNIRHIWEP
jgi:hypothetical protein